MTNREIYINQISNAEMAEKIYHNAKEKCDYCISRCSIREKEREKVLNCLIGIKKWLETKKELTADEMFEELGYETKGQKVYTILYTKDEPNKDTRFIRLHKNINGEWEYEKYYDETTSRNPNISLLITKAEHEAICKKLEELKGEANDTL